MSKLLNRNWIKVLLNLGGLSPLQEIGQRVSLAPLRPATWHSQHRPRALVHTPVTHGFHVNQERAVLPSGHAYTPTRTTTWWVPSSINTCVRLRDGWPHLSLALGWWGSACLHGQTGPSRWPAILDHTGCPPYGPPKKDTAPILQQTRDRGVYISRCGDTEHLI